MKLTSKEAYDMLMEAKKMEDSGYITHSLCVGEAAYRIADQLGLDADKAKTLGYIHDIGKRYGKPFSLHDIKGYEYLLDQNIDEEYANICLTHSYLNNDITCVAGGLINPDSYKYDFRKDFIVNHQYTIYEKIINLCDLTCTNEFLILEERLVEMMARKGVHSNTKYHISEALKLREEIEEKLGMSVSALFPEISHRFSDIENVSYKRHVYSKTLTTK